MQPFFCAVPTPPELRLAPSAGQSLSPARCRLRWPRGCARVPCPPQGTLSCAIPHPLPASGCIPSPSPLGLLSEGTPGLLLWAHPMLLFPWFSVPRRIWEHLQRLHSQHDLQLPLASLYLPHFPLFPPFFPPFPPFSLAHLCPAGPPSNIWATSGPCPSQPSLAPRALVPSQGFSPPFPLLTPTPNHPAAPLWPCPKSFFHLSECFFLTWKAPSKAGFGGKAGILPVETPGKVPCSSLAALQVEHQKHGKDWAFPSLFPAFPWLIPRSSQHSQMLSDPEGWNH